MNAQLDTRVLESAAATIRLRAPRETVVIPEHPDWTRAASFVLEACATRWGGAGALLVPHNDGAVDDIWLRLVSAYDPDHVMKVEAAVPVLAGAFPDSFEVRGSDGTPVGVAEVRAQYGHLQHGLGARDDEALAQVSGACTPFRDAGLTSDASEGIRSLSRYSLHLSGDPDKYPTSAVLQGLSEAPTGLGNAWLTSVNGPQHLGVGYGADAETASLIEGTLRERRQPLRWTGGIGWTGSLRGLTPLVGLTMRENAWLIVGSSLADFALWHNLSRVHGRSYWLPDGWLAPNSPLRPAAVQILLAAHTDSNQEPVFVLSASEDSRTIAKELAHFFGVGADRPWLEAASLEDVGDGLSGVLLALTSDYDRDATLPVYRDRSGDRSLANRLPALVPETPDVLQRNENDWVIDVALADYPVPAGRSFPPTALQGGDTPWKERVRSGRDGISIMAQSFGFVLAGSSVRQRTARPYLRFPSLSTWASEMSIAAGYEFRASDPGNVAAVAARVAGGRRALAEDLRAHRVLFVDFLAGSGQSSRERYPDDDGVVLRSEGGFLTFQRIARVCTGAIDEIRALVDRMVGNSILRRGLVLRCTECSYVQFMPLAGRELLRPCTRCGADVPLALSAWSKPLEEPNWYYDLHPTVRRLVEEHGDVPLLAEEHLRKRLRGAEGIPEFELLAGAGKAEIDLLVCSATSVAVGECKHSPSLGRKDERAKKAHALLQAASVFRADEVVLAAGKPGQWATSSVDALTAALRSGTWPAGRIPSLRLLSGLYSGTPKEVLVPAREIN
ncbi:MAG: hypothetical protein KQH57_20155 [Actinomycetales bacterium]|nr:hypothetical protein [Actinomycetales bacterium]